jgi:hypothetical protein
MPDLIGVSIGSTAALLGVGVVVLTAARRRLG